MTKDLSEIENILQYEFKNKDLLTESLTHPSLKSCNKTIIKDYERLEFLGDAVLNIVITEFLFHNFPQETEGEMARRRAMLVCKKNLAEITKKLNIAKFIFMTPGEESSGGRENTNNLENVIEAIIGAIHTDGGIDAARKFISFNWFELALSIEVAPKDSKAELQEWSQKFLKNKPTYNVVSTKGPSHSPIFTIEASILSNGKNIIAEAEAKSKKQAEKLAATILLKTLKNLNGKHD